MIRALTGFLLLLTVAVPALAQAPADAQRSIEEVRDGLYRVNNNTGFPQTTVFLVTPEGIILADPLNAEFAAWLRRELDTRFPDAPVRYVINSHYHWDHARGGGMFADTATYVAHANFVANLEAPIAAARPPGDTDDVDRDGCLTREEAQTGTRANFDAMNGNGDDCLTQDEMAADIRRPDIAFEDDLYTIELGGTRVELIHAGNRHTSDMIDLYFPDQRVLFTGDYVNLGQLCCNFAFDRKPIPDWISSLENLEQLDFDVTVNAHGSSGTKADLAAYRQQIQDLYDAVLAGIDAGQSLEQMQASITLDAYAGLANYDQLPAIIESAYRNLTGVYNR